MLEETRCATVRAYREMRLRGFSDLYAFETALGVCNQRYPGAPSDDTRFMVADWLSEDEDQAA